MSTRNLVLILLACGLLVGCHAAAPAAVSIGRNPINEAVQQTESQQMLLNLVRLRYRDVPFFLSLTSVTTTVEWEMNGRASADFASPKAARPNTLGVYGGGLYKEKPTITYIPLAGEKFVNQLMNPVESRVMMLLYHSGWSVSRIFRLLVQGMNGLPNAPSATGPTPDDEPEYKRFLEATKILRQLQEKHQVFLVLKKGKDKDSPASMHMFFQKNARDTASVKRLCELLQLPAGQESYPLFGGVFKENPEQIAVYPRSLIASMYYLSQGVQVPEAHIKKGLITVTKAENGEDFDWQNVLGGMINVRVSAWPPSDAFIRVQYRNYWYYIAGSDNSSKSTFSLLMQLFSLQAGGDKSGGPLLTIPVN